MLPRMRHPEISQEEYKKIEIQARRKLMRSNGLCDPDCEICGGLGQIRIGDGRVNFCPNLSMWDRPGSFIYGISREEAEDFHWEKILLVNNIGRAVEAIKSVLDDGYGMVYIHGLSGLGKTLTLKTAVVESLRKKNLSCYVRMAEILDHLRQGFNVQNSDECERLKRWSEIPILCIDEFDRVRSTEYSNERIFVLMDRRYELANKKKVVTIIASNSAPNQLSGYLFDRIRDGRFFIFELSGKSLRPGMERK